MRTLAKTGRLLAIAFAGLFIVMSLGGAVGAWFVSHAAGEIAMKGFTVIEVGVAGVDAGVGRMDELIARSRTEVKDAAQTITAVGAQAAANRPVLNALSERLETNLAPRVAQLRENLAPVREAVAKVENAVSFLSSFPMVSERAPRLAALDESVDRLEALSADATQLRSTLRELANAQTNEVAPETVATLKGLAERMDNRLGQVHAKVQSVRKDVDALKDRIEKKKSRLLLALNLIALLMTLLLAWVIYAQVVVIKHHRSRLRGSVRPDSLAAERRTQLAPSPQQISGRAHLLFSRAETSTPEGVCVYGWAMNRISGFVSLHPYFRVPPDKTGGVKGGVA